MTPRMVGRVATVATLGAVALLASACPNTPAASSGAKGQDAGPCPQPTAAPNLDMGATAFLGLLFHLRFETTAWPADPLGWAAIAALGLGPVGAAFFAWDHGVKRGDIRALAALSYASPLLSTLLLVLSGRAVASWTIAAACVLIVGGALIAARDLWRR